MSFVVTGSRKRKGCRDSLEFEKVKMQASKGVDAVDDEPSAKTHVCVKNF